MNLEEQKDAAREQRPVEVVYVLSGDGAKIKEQWIGRSPLEKLLYGDPNARKPQGILKLPSG
jgi:hypothetical protein